MCRDLRHHQRADDHQRGRGDLGRHDRHERREEHRDEEQQAGDDVREPGAGALADAGAGLDEDGVRRRRGVAAGDGADALDDERGLDAREVALLVGESGLFRQAGHGAHRVEEVREHEGEDEHERGEHADALERAERDLADERQVGHAHERRGQLGHREAPAAGVDAVVGELRADVPDRLDDDARRPCR